LSAALALLVITAASPADDREAPNVVPPPPPEALTLGEPVEPEVTITREGQARIEEYSVNGQVYAVRVEPVIGPAYYLYDFDGDGQLDSRYGALREIPKTPQWRIFSW
jgi:hypothetical protein